MEIWKTIEYFDNYKISQNGIVFSILKNGPSKILKPEKVRKGYLRVKLFKNGNGIKVSVHRLVAAAFIPNPNNLPEVNHKDKNKLNNNVENLEWVSGISNINHYRKSVSKTGMVGVSWFERDQNWRARFARNKVHYHLGYFSTIDDATNAIKEKLKELGVE